MLIQLRSCSLIQLKCSLCGYNWGSAQPTYTKLYPHRLHFNCIKEHIYYTWIQWNCSNHLWGDSWVTGGVCLYGKPGCVYVILILKLDTAESLVCEVVLYLLWIQFWFWCVQACDQPGSRSGNWCSWPPCVSQPASEYQNTRNTQTQRSLSVQPN